MVENGALYCRALSFLENGRVSFGAEWGAQGAAICESPTPTRAKRQISAGASLPPPCQWYGCSAAEGGSAIRKSPLLAPQRRSTVPPCRFAESLITPVICGDKTRASAWHRGCYSISHMKSRNSATVSDSRVDLSRFELFVNVFVRTPARGSSRRAARRR